MLQHGNSKLGKEKGIWTFDLPPGHPKTAERVPVVPQSAGQSATVIMG